MVLPHRILPVAAVRTAVVGDHMVAVADHTATAEWDCLNQSKFHRLFPDEGPCRDTGRALLLFGFAAHLYFSHTYFAVLQLSEA